MKSLAERSWEHESMGARGLMRVRSVVVPRECSRGAAWAGCVVLVVAAVGYAARVNPFSLFGPDSGDYVVLARSLATGHGYRLVSERGWPVHTLRPPGLPLLLLPAAWAAPYSVMAAKLVVVAVSVVLLVALWRMAGGVLGAEAGLAALALVATSPFMALFATEVLSENPYVCVTLVGLILLGRMSRGSAERWEWIACGALLGAGALVRTAGVTLLVPASVWLVVQGLRGGPRAGEIAEGRRAVSWKVWGIALALAWLPLTTWVVRNLAVGAAVHYWQNLGAQEGQSLAARFFEVPVRNIPYYLGRLGWLAAPVVWPDHTMLADLIPLGHPWVAGRWAAWVGGAVLALALVGLWVRKRRDGWAALGYVIVYLALLALYTFQSIRFLWTIWPVILIYALAGGEEIVGWVRGWALARPRDEEGAGGLAIEVGWSRWALGRGGRWVVLGALVAGPVWLSGGMVRISVWSVLWPDDFYAQGDRLDLLYYADTRSAGRWLREHAAANARILTEDSALYGASRRQQQFEYLETLGAAGLVRRIRESGASYVVVADHSHLPRDLTYSDGAAYRFEAVYRGRMIRIYHVRPNLEGTVELDQPPTSSELAAIAERLRGLPADSRIGIQLMHVLGSEGAADVAVEVGLRALENGVELINLHLAVASNLIYAGRYEEAIRYATEARKLQDADFQRPAIEGAIQAATAFMRRDDERLSRQDRAQASLEIASACVAGGQPRQAAEELERAYKLAAELPEVQLLRGRLLDLLGRWDEALRMFERAAAAGDEDAVDRAAAYRWREALEGGKATTVRVADRAYRVNPAEPKEHVRLAELWTASDQPGRALAVMIRAAELFPGDPSVHFQLGTRYAEYGLFDEAVAALERAAKLRPNDTGIRARLRQVVEDSRVPPAP